MKQVIDGKTYNTDTATRLADNEFSDSDVNRMNTGRASYLYKTHKGAYFAAHFSAWEGESDRLEVLTKERAMEMWERMKNQAVEYADAFGVDPIEA